MKKEESLPKGGRRTAAGAATMLGLLAIVAAGGWFLGTGLAAANEGLLEAAERAEARETATGAGEAPVEQRLGDDTVIVGMTNGLAFEPKATEIRVGQTVRWENTSDVPHTVTADPAKTGNPDRVKLPDGAEPFGSELLGAGETFAHTFTVPGEYRYFCIPHQMAGMVGTVVVRP